MVLSLYNNYDSIIYKSIYSSTVSAVAENLNTNLYDSVQPMRVAAYKSKHITVIVKLRGFERALYRCEDQHMKMGMLAAISQQQRV